MAKVRNPLAGFGITIALALGFSFFMCVPILFLPQAELVYFYLPFALFGVGAFAGRSGFLGTLGFIGATMGAFLGVYAFQSVFLPQRWPLWFSDWALLLDAASGACCGLGGLASGKVGRGAATVGSPGAIGSRYSGSRYRRPSASIAM